MFFMSPSYTATRTLSPKNPHTNPEAPFFSVVAIGIMLVGYLFNAIM